MVWSGWRRRRGLGLCLGAFVLALPGACDTFDSGGSSAIGGFGFGNPGDASISSGGSIFLGSGGTDQVEPLCPPFASGGSAGGSGKMSPMLDSGLDSGGSKTTGQGGEAGSPDPGSAGAGDGGVAGASESSEGGRGGAGGDDGTGGTSDPASGCPNREPAVGPCTEEHLVCTYGDQMNVSCRRSWTCFNGLWSTSAPCSPEQQSACPAGAPEYGSACPVPVTCSYGASTLCQCANCNDGNCWICEDAPVRPDGCPGRAPAAGSACSSEPVECLYGECFSGEEPIIAVCCHGAWTSKPFMCPIVI